MFWMCNDEMVINLDHVQFFRKEQTDDIPEESNPRICFYLKNVTITDVYDSEEDRNCAYDTLIKSLDVII